MQAAGDSVMEQGALFDWQQLLAALGLNEAALRVDGLPLAGSANGAESAKGNATDLAATGQGDAHGICNESRRDSTKNAAWNVAEYGAPAAGSASSVSPTIVAALKARAKVRLALKESHDADAATRSDSEQKACAGGRKDATGKPVGTVEKTGKKDVAKSTLQDGMNVVAAGLGMSGMAPLQTTAQADAPGAATTADAGTIVSAVLRPGRADGALNPYTTGQNEENTLRVAARPGAEMHAAPEQQADVTADAQSIPDTGASTQTATPKQTDGKAYEAAQANARHVAAVATQAGQPQISNPISMEQVHGVDAADGAQEPATLSQIGSMHAGIATKATTEAAKSVGAPQAAGAKDGHARTGQNAAGAEAAKASAAAQSVGMHAADTQNTHIDVAAAHTAAEQRAADVVSTGSVSAVGHDAMTGANTINALDSGNANAPAWVHAGRHQAEAGFEDPVLGWVGVRAHADGTGVHAEVVPVSQDAALSLSTHMSGLQAYLAEHHRQIETVQVAMPEPYAGFGGGMTGGSGTGANGGQPQQGAASQREWSGDVVSSPHSTGRMDAGTDSRLRSAAMMARARAGTHVSVMA
ncbi:MAG TPA: hypothetical protein VG844_10365 [Terracidiphilus sp.]|nr:hypothetical protein [Terracidiphilus sp.]